MPLEQWLASNIVFNYQKRMAIYYDATRRAFVVRSPFWGDLINVLREVGTYSNKVWSVKLESSPYLFQRILGKRLLLTQLGTFYTDRFDRWRKSGLQLGGTSVFSGFNNGGRDVVKLPLRAGRAARELFDFSYRPDRDRPSEHESVSTVCRVYFPISIKGSASIVVDGGSIVENFPITLEGDPLLNRDYAWLCQYTPMDQILIVPGISQEAQTWVAPIVEESAPRKTRVQVGRRIL